MGKGGGGGVPETQQEIESKRVAIQQWNDHQARLLPFENAYLTDVERDPAARTGRALGQVNADMAQSTPALAVPPGMNPNSGAVMGVPALAAPKAAKAAVTAGQNVLDERAQGLQSAVDLGQGKATNAMQGYEVAAADAAGKAGFDASVNQANRSALGGMVMSGAGALAWEGKNLWQNRNAAGNLGQFSDQQNAAALMGADKNDPSGYHFDASNGNYVWNR